MKYFRTSILVLLLGVSSVFAVDGIAIKSRYPSVTGGAAAAYLDNSDGEDLLNNDIVRINIVNSQQSGSPVLLAEHAGRETLSPDGQKVAFLKWVDNSKSKLCVMSINGGAATELCEVESEVSIDFPTNQYVYFNGGNGEKTCPNLGGALSGEIWRIDILKQNAQKEKVVTLYCEGDTTRVARGGSVDVSENLSRICFHTSNPRGGISCNGTTVDAPRPYGGYVVFDMANKLAGDKGILMINNAVSCDACTNGDGKADNSCGGGMSYDGKYVYDGWVGHMGYDVRDAGNMGNLVASVSCGNKHKPGAALRHCGLWQVPHPVGYSEASQIRPPPGNSPVTLPAPAEAVLDFSFFETNCV